ncbi:CTD kinase subunit gamma [Cryptococcus neoformans C23]|uniref:CTD kinase subunit gamma n=2 Tax=Cryptococcus neoformans TaxID=5207 RepID=A0A854QEK7_CRYNE|nr:CTD kinase subunit gamma [Cryptococcus neoformans var. grubii H99]AUB27260.1 CTD kinase subunit gamma [Cryptococcus neoformans var. grubii]OWZ28969.1 CTD kinase subunit gamma [Cryptococcus neoformans var. grubii AD2-60a]OWZ40919.1 CTD kinase subunit gamma [Cryptococcus neoformans var. grubii C23]OXC82724.1 CTD kinase subunit gamma [Cryptococcus neoformans var. grubii AD1-7a]OXG13404.1 CTD kinase subunit gamma [Cryptococcus neoformans var. grubii Tu401-1]OXG14914.1 CTD kinase subunit gamma |eukprot:XP_012051578.1 CTD kinase subunit gamma [Cryptococcus neoformans var. grubii H99]
MSSFDPFETRIQFINLLRKLNASQQSIQKVTSFAINYGARCGEDLWECVIEQCNKGTLNTRINILYFLDTLVEESLALGPSEAPYGMLLTRDLKTLVDSVVPDTNAGKLNLKSARQILESWRLRRVVDPGVVGDVLKSLEGRKYDSSGPSQKRTHEHAFSKTDIVRRMEEDRERHKRLRERIWILPIPSLLPSKNTVAAPTTLSSSTSNASPATPASPHPSSLVSLSQHQPQSLHLSASVSAGAGAGAEDDMAVSESALDVEFEQIWDRVPEEGLDDDDILQMRADMRRAKLEIAPTSTAPIQTDV